MDCADCSLRSVVADNAADGTSFEMADAAMRSANFDDRSKLFSFSMPCNDESSYNKHH